MTPVMREVLTALRGKQFPLDNERQTKADIYAVLTQTFGCGEWVVGRLVKLTCSERIDFLIWGSVAVYVELDADAGAIRRQIKRYVADTRVEGLILLTPQLIAVTALVAGKAVVEHLLLPQGVSAPSEQIAEVARA
jgi:hypothetical protein